MKTILLTSIVTVALVLLVFFAGFFARDLVDAVRPDTKLVPEKQGKALLNPPVATPKVVQPVDAPKVDGVSVDDDPARGSENAQVTIIEFSDFQCSFCKRYFDQTFPQILNSYGDQVRYVYRDFPLATIHPMVTKAHEAARCAFEQGKFWEYHEVLFQNQGALDVASLKEYAANLALDTSTFKLCLDSGENASEVQKDLKDGQAYGVTGTPTFFINGRRLVGAQPFTNFKQIIEEELEKASNP